MSARNTSYEQLRRGVESPHVHGFQGVCGQCQATKQQTILSMDWFPALPYRVVDSVLRVDRVQFMVSWDHRVEIQGPRVGSGQRQRGRQVCHRALNVAQVGEGVGGGGIGGAEGRHIHCHALRHSEVDQVL